MFKKSIITVALVVLSGSAFAHNWFPEGQRITHSASGGQASATPLTTNRSFNTKDDCETFLTEQRSLNSFRDGNGKSMVSVVVAACHNAPVVMRVIVPAP